MTEEVPLELSWVDRVERLRADPRTPLVALLFVLVAAAVVWLRLGADDSPAPPALAAPVSSTSTTHPATLLVHVVGAVRTPGVIELEAGARVVDAVDVAGGATADADLAQLNLAAPVGDGQRIAVPRVGEVLAETVDSIGTPTSAGPVNLNTATVAQLETLPGIGPALADAIVRTRAEQRFASIDDLKRVRGIGDARFEQLRDLVTI